MQLPKGTSVELPVSVVIPTIGRARLLRQCLDSLATCRPYAAEVLIVDQSQDDRIRRVVEASSIHGASVVACSERGFALGLNVGIRAARHEVVLVTNDDCTVAPDWVGVAWDRMCQIPDGIVTGQVRPVGDPAAIPSTKVDPEPHDYTGNVTFEALYAGNMTLNRSLVIAMGGFDERPGMRVAAEDCDFCYRWTKAGGVLRYEPRMVVWHNDWRTPRELAERYVAYARGQGTFYAKHLRAGDRDMLRYIARDLGQGWRSLAEGIRYRQPRWADSRRGILRGLPAGLVAGWLEDRRLTRSEPSGG